MKNVSFEHLNIQRAAKPSGPRNQKEDLIEQIVAQCHFRKPGDDRKLAKLLAVTANAAGWTITDLHALLKKRSDPTLRNYTAFVWWSAKMKNSKA